MGSTQISSANRKSENYCQICGHSANVALLEFAICGFKYEQNKKIVLKIRLLGLF
jgi:hypothetical protein